MQKKKFKVGICMAGAISAGAYTAGVIDYLLEALDIWQKRKDLGIPDTPLHEVEISVIGGASAGGMTGIITASALYDPIKPVSQASENILGEIKTNKLYHSWVDLVSENMLEELLDTSDIKKNELKSLLNAQFIEKIANRALCPGNNHSIDKPYIAKNMQLFVTLSNLNGMSFNVAFNSNSMNHQYIIKSHNDYACFMLANNESEYKDDGFIPLNIAKGLNTELAKEAAMATGAFPVGLAARSVNRNGKYLNDLTWFKHITRDRSFATDYPSIHVDGGMINNEPFEKVQELLLERKNKEKNVEVQNDEYIDSTVLMIDPFPSEEEKNFNGTTELTSVIGNTLSALLNQSRIKPSTIEEALDNKQCDKFLIAPVRYHDGHAIHGKKAIACGSLDGFGGFISKEFRIHDYFLGRSNCEKFLRDHFTIPMETTNPIFLEGYAGISKLKFTGKTNATTGEQRRQIIPLFSDEQSQPYMPIFSNGKQFPAVTENFIRSHKRNLKKRVEKMMLNLSESNSRQRFLLWIGAKVVLNKKIANGVLDKVVCSLKCHNLLK